MPQTKPQQIKPAGQQRHRLGGDRRLRGRQGRAQGGRAVPARPQVVPARSAPRSPRASCSTVRRAPARRCWPRRSPTSRARSSSASRPPRSSRCSPAWAPPASGACSPRRASPRPAIIFIDELDAVGGRRGSDISGERDQTLNQLLVEMDGFDARGDIVVMAASNLLDKLDPALLRPGRFDRQVFVAPPDVAGREKILEVHTRNKPVADVDLGARRPADQRPHRRRPRQHLPTRPRSSAPVATGTRSSRRTSTTRSSASSPACSPAACSTTHEKRVVAFHEAGHALCGELLPTVDRVHKISIVPRGRALGYTLNLPDEDRYLKTREELVGLHDRPARRPGRRAPRLRRDHHRRVRRRPAGRRDRPRDDPRVRDGQRTARARSDAERMSDHRRRRSTRSSRSSPSRPSAMPRS